MIPLSRPLLGSEERAVVDRVLASGHIAGGPEVEAFEDEFAALVSGRRCVAVNSGTSALHLGMLAAGIGPGDEVIVPSFTFAASANAIRLCGATPVFVDVEPATFCLDPAAVEAAVTSATSAIMPVHLYGHPADMRRIGATAERHGLLVIEDAAQAHGAALDGRPAGSFGDVAAFSFYPTKNMTTGEGGMIVARDGETARLARLLRNQGMEARYRNEVVGFNARMTDIAAAIGRVQLGRLPAWTAARQENAQYLDTHLRGVVPPEVVDGASHVYHQYTVRMPDRDEVQKALDGKGIGTGVYYPIPVHRLPPFASDAVLPETERAAEEVLSLPVRPDLTGEELELIVAAVNEETA